MRHPPQAAFKQERQFRLPDGREDNHQQRNHGHPGQKTAHYQKATTDFESAY
jgi:hypothetical protein